MTMMCIECICKSMAEMGMSRIRSLKFGDEPIRIQSLTLGAGSGVGVNFF